MFSNNRSKSSLQSIRRISANWKAAKTPNPGWLQPIPDEVFSSRISIETPKYIFYFSVTTIWLAAGLANPVEDRLMASHKADDFLWRLPSSSKSVDETLKLAMQDKY
uniref:Uncharacterized protein n=1 Tax=Romanomermis culicivorax TaxID=13658 RepID=A0A915IY22_ROMCU